jgi:hypothetical protein
MPPKSRSETVGDGEIVGILWENVRATRESAMPLKIVAPVAPAQQDRRHTSRALAVRVHERHDSTGGFLVVAFGATLNVLPPGRRGGNRFWMVRGTLADGRRIEVSSKTAERFARSLVAGHSATEARRR